MIKDYFPTGTGGPFFLIPGFFHTIVGTDRIHFSEKSTVFASTLKGTRLRAA